MLQLKTTPFHSRTSALMQGNQWRRWSSHSVASAYELAHDREYLAIRNACAVIDVSPLCKYHITGPEAAAYLNRLVTRDVSKLSRGGLLYTPWCDSQGKVIDDGTLAHLGENFYRLTAAEPNYRWLCDNRADFDVTIEDVSDDFGTLALQGPMSREVLAEMFEGVRGLRFYRWMEVQFQGQPLVISRTGYTGDLGYELWVPRVLAEPLWDRLMEVGRRYAIQPAGIWALDVARVEAGLIMLDVDYTPVSKAVVEAQTSSPFELGLQWALNFNKGHFIGRRALLEERDRGSKYALVGLMIDHVRLEEEHEAMGLPVHYPFIPWRAMLPVFAEGPDSAVSRPTVAGRQVGYATCGCWSPTLKRYLALAQVEPNFAELGQPLVIDLLVDRFRRSIPAVVAHLPFFNPERKKS